MASFRPWDVVRVPFPYTDRPMRQHRPALVVAAGLGSNADELLWVLMITSAENRPWGSDVGISNLRAAGLPAPSLVRCAKIATIQAGDAQKIGAISASDRAAVRESLAALLAGALMHR